MKKSFKLILAILCVAFQKDVYATTVSVVDVSTKEELVSCMESTQSVECNFKSNIILDEVVNVTNDVVLELNDKKLTLNNNSSIAEGLIVIENTGNLVIGGSDNSILESNVTNKNVIYNKKFLKLCLSQVNINNSDTSGFLISNAGEVLISKGTFNINSLSGMLVNQSTASEVRIDGGTFNIKKGHLIQNDDSSCSIVINDGIFINKKSANSIISNNTGESTITINGGTYKDDTDITDTNWFNAKTVNINYGIFKLNKLSTVLTCSASATIADAEIDAEKITNSCPTLTIGINDTKIRDYPKINLSKYISGVTTLNFYDGTVTGKFNPPYYNVTNFNTINNKFNVKTNSDGTYTMRLYNDPLNINLDYTMSKSIVELAKSDTINLETDEYGNTRYIGANPNNYVCFTSDGKTCINYNSKTSTGLFRIIGVFNEDSHGIANQSLIKLISVDGEQIVWDSNNQNDWTKSTLKTKLNGDYLKNTLTSVQKSMIKKAVWYLGGPNSQNDTNFYSFERGTTVYTGNATTWTGKIGLIYPSDFKNASSGNSACFTNSNWNDKVICNVNDWLIYSGARTNAQGTAIDQWTISHYTSYVDHVFVAGFGGIGTFHVYYSPVYARPSFYLNSEVYIVGGDGTSSSPYLISSSKIDTNSNTDTNTDNTNTNTNNEVNQTQKENPKTGAFVSAISIIVLFISFIIIKKRKNVKLFKI